VTPVPIATIRDAVMAVQELTVAGAIVPIENSIEGAVTVTLDTLAREAPDVRIVGDVVHPVVQCLIAPEPMELQQIVTVVSHPQATGQCARFLRERLPQARVVSADSTAGAVVTVSRGREPGWAALGPALSARAYGCVVLSEGVEDHDDNETRFVWLAREQDGGPFRAARAAAADGAGGLKARPFRTSLVFWGPGDDGPGWLVSCLDEFARRGVNLTKIESRPQRVRLGHYMFFADADGASSSPELGEAIAGLRARCQEVRVLGSYPSAA
jgi:prephenate dehydratase